jgi:16S rRNA C967 or C1407 C5-methylase (RsmB/RsmF family)
VKGVFMNNKIQEYLRIKREYEQLLKQPIGNRIKENGKLEQKIKKVFGKERSEQILTKSESFQHGDFERYESLKLSFHKLRDELEEIGMLEYDEYGNEILAKEQ